MLFRQGLQIGASDKDLKINNRNYHIKPVIEIYLEICSK